jgi:hypothetical protein
MQLEGTGWFQQRAAWADAEELASFVERIPDEQLSEYSVDEKNGTYYRCLQGPIEHGYYHLGQIAIIKTMLQHDGDSRTAVT